MLKEDLLKCDQYSEQAKLLAKYHVDTDEDLSMLMGDLRDKLTVLGSERDELRLKVKRVLPEAEITEAKEGVKELTKEMRELRRELKVCGEVKERSSHVRENLEIVERDRSRGKEAVR